MLTFEDGRVVYIDKTPRGVLVSEADKVTNVSYNQPVLGVSGPYIGFAVRDNNLTILEDGIGNTITIDSATRVPGLSKRHRGDIDPGNTMGKERLAHTETTQTDNIKYVVYRLIGNVTQDGMTTYVVC